MAEPQDALAPASILVVDDEPEVLEMLRVVLEEEGLHVETAPDGLSALDQAGRRRPALVVLDMMLPDLDGDAVAVRLHEAHGRSLPIMIVSAHPEAARRAERAGAFAVLAKPFDLDAFIGTVWFGLKRGNGLQVD